MTYRWLGFDRLNWDFSRFCSRFALQAVPRHRKLTNFRCTCPGRTMYGRSAPRGNGIRSEALTSIIWRGADSHPPPQHLNIFSDKNRKNSLKMPV